MSLAALLVSSFGSNARAVPDVEIDLSENNQCNVQTRPSSTGNVFNAGFSSGGDGNGDGISDTFEAHGQWDYVAKPNDYDHSFGGGYQRLIIKQVYPQLVSGVDHPGGARLNVANEPKPRGGDVGIHKCYDVHPGDTYTAEAWVRLESVSRINPTDFKARLTFHKYNPDTNKYVECPNDAEYLDVTAQLQPMRGACEIDSDRFSFVRVNIRAHAMNDGTNRAAASGIVAVDSFRLDMTVRSLL